VSETIDDVRSLIRSRLAEIEAETTQLRQVAESMGAGRRSRRSPSRAESPARPKRRAAPKRGGRKRAARGQRREELLVAIKAGPGSRPSELARTMGVRPTQVSVLIAKARAEKLIVKRGEGYALKG
jgi:hypothetical protein